MWHKQYFLEMARRVHAQCLSLHRQGLPAQAFAKSVERQHFMNRARGLV